MQAKGLAATKCRTPAEWRASEQGKVVKDLPPIVMEPLRYLDGAREGASISAAPRLLPSKAARPLSDVLVLDFSHVIARSHECSRVHTGWHGIAQDGKDFPHRWEWLTRNLKRSSREPQVMT